MNNENNIKINVFESNENNFISESYSMIESEYIDESGNILKPIDNSLFIKLKKSGIVDGYEGVLDLMTSPEFLKICLKRFNEAEDINLKIIRSKIMLDCISEMRSINKDGDGLMYHFSDNDYEQYKNDLVALYRKEKNAFISLYIGNRLGRLFLDEYRMLIEDDEDDDLAEIKKEIENKYEDIFKLVSKNKDFLEYHDTKYDKVNFIFSDEDINKISLDGPVDYGGPTEPKESFELHPGRDYIVRSLAEDLVGLYSFDGSLIGWCEKNDCEDNNISYVIGTKIFFEKRKMNTKISKKVTVNSVNSFKNKLNFRKTKEDLALFKIISSLDLRENIENILSINLADYNLRVQYQFLNFISSKNKESFFELANFLKKDDNLISKQHKVKSFLALESEDGLGQNIIKIQDKFGEESDIIYKQLADILDLATKETEELEIMALNLENYLPVSEKIHSNLISESCKIIKSLDYKIDQGDEIKEITKEFKKNKTEIILLSSVLKNIDQSKFSFEDLSGVKLGIIDYNEKMTQADKEEIVSIAEQNWKQNSVLGEQVIKDLRTCLDNDDQRRYILRLRDFIIAFIRFEKNNDGSLHAASLNITNDLRGAKIGEKMMQTTLLKEAENSILKATVSPRLKVGTSYINSLGFVIDGYIDNYKSTGEDLFTITLDKNSDKKYKFNLHQKRDLIKNEEIEKMCKNNLYKIGDNPIVLGFDMLDIGQYEKMRKAMIELLPKKNDKEEMVDKESGYAITRYFESKKNPKKDLRFFVFEKIV